MRSLLVAFGRSSQRGVGSSNCKPQCRLIEPLGWIDQVWCSSIRSIRCGGQTGTRLPRPSRLPGSTGAGCGVAWKDLGGRGPGASGAALAQTSPQTGHEAARCCWRDLVRAPPPCGWERQRGGRRANAPWRVAAAIAPPRTARRSCSHLLRQRAGAQCAGAVARSWGSLPGSYPLLQQRLQQRRERDPEVPGQRPSKTL